MWSESVRYRSENISTILHVFVGLCMVGLKRKLLRLMEHTRIAFGIGHTPCGIGRLDPVVLVYGLLVYFDVFCVFKYEERELNFVLLGNYTIHTHIYIFYR